MAAKTLAIHRRLPRAATTAYRAQPADVPSDWVAVVAIIEHAGLVAAAARKRLLRRGGQLAVRAVGRRALDRFIAGEWRGSSRRQVAALVLLSERLVDAGAVALAAAGLDALSFADDSLNVIERGRIMARRARASWMMGCIDEARHSYQRLDLIGRRSDEPELRVRAQIGYVALAQMRGNYPEMQKYARRAARIADRAGLHRLARQARNGLLIAASMRRQFDEALALGWLVYRASAGDSVGESETLQNIGQTLTLAGHVAAARAAFAAVVARELPTRVMLPALGGLALACAAVGDAASVRWAAREVKRCPQASAPRYALASALLECATALAAVGRVDEGRPHRIAALQLARAHGFFEIAYRAEELESSAQFREPAVPVPLATRATSIAQRMSVLEPRRLPRHVEFQET